MLPQRPPGATPARASGHPPTAVPQSFEAVKARVLTRLEERLSPAASKRMPSSILRQSLRTYAEQLAEQEGARLAKPDRERLVEEVLAELLGYGPLDELFKDPAVREVLVAGPQAVLVRRDTAGWVPTNVKFRDEAHVRSALDRLATHADPVGGITASVNLFDLKLPNGFRAVAVIPPEALGRPASAAFVREATLTPAIAAPSARPLAAPATGSGTGSASAATRPAPAPPPPPTPASGPAPVATTARPTPALVAAPMPRPGSGPVPAPAPTPAPAQPDALELTQVAVRDPIARYRKPILDRLTARLAHHGVYDVQRVEITELRKIVTAYISEYLAREKLYLSDADQGRLMLEILTAMHR